MDRTQYPYTDPWRARWASEDRPACPFDHAGKHDGEWRRGWLTAIGAVITRNGAIQYKGRCLGCGWTSGPLPHGVATEWLGGQKVAWLRINEAGEYPACSVRDCGAAGVDRHHFAPRNTFGSEAEDWPVMPLCKDHHVRWHTMMDGYRWHARRSA